MAFPIALGAYRRGSKCSVPDFIGRAIGNPRGAIPPRGEPAAPIERVTPEQSTLAAERMSAPPIDIKPTTSSGVEAAASIDTKAEETAAPIVEPKVETPVKAPPEPAQPIGQGPGARTFTPSTKPETPESFEGTALKNAVAELEAQGIGHDLTPAEQHAMAPLWENAGKVLEVDPNAGKRC